MLPRSLLDSLKDRMYPDRNKTETGVFDIDWDSLAIKLSQGERVSINEYYHNLVEPECYPSFKDWSRPLFLIRSEDELYMHVSSNLLAKLEQANR